MLTVRGAGFQVQFDGCAADRPADARLSARGTLSVVGSHEWEAFGLDDTRTDWTVRQVLPLDDGGVMVDLERTLTSPEQKP